MLAKEKEKFKKLRQCKKKLPTFPMDDTDPLPWRFCFMYCANQCKSLTTGSHAQAMEMAIAVILHCGTQGQMLFSLLERGKMTSMYTLLALPGNRVATGDYLGDVWHFDAAVRTGARLRLVPETP